MTSLFAGLGSFSIVGTPNPPTQITREAYLNWLKVINSNISAFSDDIFSWYNDQISGPLPLPVNNDPDKIYLVVDRAIQETDLLENAGEIDEGNTFGFDSYGLADVPLSVSLETALFFSGKPIGKPEGDTYPFGILFSRCHCSMQERWDQGNYFSTQSYTGGGIVQDLNDEHTILIRGNATDGFVIFDTFFGVISDKDSATVAHFSILMLKSRSDGQTEFRRTWRLNGQNYKMFGIENGRRLFGFNVAKFRSGEKSFIASMKELKSTGKIRENRPQVTCD